MARTIVTAGINYGLAIIGVPSVVVYGAAYSFTLKKFAGSAPYKFTEIGSLPSGITFTDNGNGTATFAGTTTSPGDYPITVTLSDGSRNVVTNNYTLSVQAIALSLSGHLPNQTVGAAITPYTYSATGGFGGYTYAIISGALPTGLSLNTSTGQVTGTPTAGGSFSWTVRVTDSHSQISTLPDSCSVAFATLTLTGTSPNAEVGVAYSWGPTAAGGNGSNTFSITSGSVPAGTSLNTSTGVVSGTPTTASTPSFTVHCHSGDGQDANSAQSITVYAAIALSGTASSPVNVGASFSYTPTTTGGSGGVTYSVGSGSLPSGTSLNTSTGAVTGTITGSATTYTFVIHAVDSLGGAANTSSQSVVVVAVATWSNAGSGLTLSNSNFDAAPNGTNSGTARGGSPVARNSVLHYYEFSLQGAPGSGARTACGICTTGVNLSAYLGSDAFGMGNYNTGSIYRGGNPVGTGVTTTSGSIVRLAAKYNSGAGTIDIWVALNGGAWAGGGDPALGTLAVASMSVASGASLQLACGNDTAPSTAKWRLQSAFTYAIPSGFTRWPG